MNEYIEVGQPLQFTDPNTPTRVGEIVENVSDIYNIPSPRLGMQVFVKSEKNSFVITSLKSKVIGGVDVPEAAVEAFEPVSAKSFTWNNDTDPSNMNDFVVAGVYDIKGERTRIYDNLPILNTGGGHTFNARLTVLDSSITGSGKDDDKCITQVLSFSNRLGQGEVYIRTGKGASLDNLTWEKWSTLQRNVNVGEVQTLDNLIDNGIYSGVLTTTGEMFALVVINNYAVAGNAKSVSQFKYSIPFGGSFAKYETRVGGGNPVSFHYGWEILNKNEIDSMIKSSVDNAIKGVIADAPEAFDTLKEIADWIANDKTGAAAMLLNIQQNTAKIDAEVNRAQAKEKELSGAILANYQDIVNNEEKVTQADNKIKAKAAHINTLHFTANADNVTLSGKAVDGNAVLGESIPVATTENAGVMTAEDKKEQVKMTPLVNGDIIVGQAREIHSRNGKNDSASFFVRTTAGSGTIGDGVASLKSVGGNIVKNLVDGTFKSGWAGTTVNLDKGINHVKPTVAYGGGGYFLTPISGHKYYVSAYVFQKDKKTVTMRYGAATYYNTNIGGWQLLSHIGTDVTSTSITYVCGNNITDFFITKTTCIDLTELFNAGKEPSKEECDKLFGTMDALPQGLSIANPTVFKSTGFNQFNPDMVLEGKAIVDNAIVDGYKTLAIIPCLPCKIGEGENNGYHIHGEFGEDIKVYLTPLNPMEVEGELYMHELTLSEKGTYVPQIKGYMIVEVPTTANLCAHFLWSEDCDKNAYEPYYESVVELPRIPEMSEYGLAGIQSSGTLACDEIDFVKGVYRKKIGAVDLGSLSWTFKESTSSNEAFLSSIIDGFLKQSGYNKPPIMICEPYVSINSYNIDHPNNLDKSIFVHADIGNRVYIKDSRYSDAASFKAAMQGVMLYYELAEPIEYPLPKVNNNYTSSDYGVEQFDSLIPCNANNLYYMRSLAGETRNFLDKMYANTAKESSKDVADYITEGIEENKAKAEEAPNLALRSLYVAAGANYNADTGYYELNGITDLTENDMAYIYAHKDYVKSLAVARYFQGNRTVRTIYPLNCENTNYDQLFSGNRISVTLPYYSCNIEVLKFSKMQNLSQTNGIPIATGSMSSVFCWAQKLKTIYPINVSGITSTGASFDRTTALVDVRLVGLKCSVSFKDSINLSKESVLYIIQNASPTSAITITLHADAYARLAEDADIVAALAAQPLVTLVSA